MAVNITTNNNTVKVVTTPANKVKVVNNITNTSVTVSQPTPTQVVRVVTAGPQGPAGPQGDGANINTGSFATTGSNNFIGKQILSASQSDLSALDIHAVDQTLWAFRVYNDLYSSTQPGLGSWIDNTGEANIGTEVNKPLYIYTNANYGNPTLIISSSGVTVRNNLTVTGNQVITGSLTVSGSNTFTNIGPAVFSGSINVTQGISGSFSGSGANLNSIPASAITGLSTTQIATGSVTASVSTGTGSFQITSGSTSLMFISSSGNVGIGTLTPAYKLSVNGTIDAGLNLIGSGVWNQGIQPQGGTGELRFVNSTGNGFFFTWVQNNGVERMRLSTNNNLLIGTTADSARLQVRGSGATSATTALRVENTNASASLVILDNGFVGINTGSAQYNLDVNGTARVVSTLVANTGVKVGGASGVGGVYVQAGSTLNQECIALRGSLLTTDIGSDIILSSGNGSAANTTSIKTLVRFSGGFVPASGTGVYNVALIDPTINQTGGANGITRGLYINPTLTSAADFRAIETTRGNVLFQSGSTPLLFVSESGNIGIGTSTFVGSIKLAVNGQIGGPTYSSTYLDVSTDAAQLRGNSGIGFYAASNDHIFYGASSVERARITNAGNVGIGTPSPSASLHISGASSANLLRIDSPASSSILFVSGSGNVGIGTASPQEKLQVVGGNILFGNGYNLRSITNSGGISNVFGTTASNELLFGSGNWTLIRFDVGGAAARMSIPSTGNVLINTTTDAGYKLDVSGSARVSDISYLTLGARIGTTTTAAGIFPSGTSGRESLNLRSSLLPTDTGNDVVITNGQGDVGNTSSIRSLLTVARSFAPTSGTGVYNLIQVNPTINQTGGANGITRGLYINPTLTSAADFRAIETTRGNVLFQSGSTPLLFVSESGNVGIGTTTPAYKLDVSGSTFTRKLIVGSDSTYTGIITGSDFYMKGTSNSTVFVVRDTNNNTLFAAAGASGTSQFYAQAYNIGLGTATLTSANKVHILSNGATSATTALLVQNSTPTNLLSINDIGQVAFTSPTMSLAASQSAFSISPIISASAVVGGQYYGVNITPTFFQTTGSQTKTAFRVAATYTGSSAAATGGTNIIADFGSTSAGSQLTVTDVTSGSIYMVNDVSGLPIIEATSDWGVKIYDFPRVVLEKTGSQVNINGTLRVSGSFILPLSQSATPQTGSAYWSGSLLFIYNGTRYMSASFF